MPDERGIKWWISRVIVPLLGTLGVAALLIFVPSQDGNDVQTSPLPRQPNEAAGPIRLGQINSKNPDYVDVVNKGESTARVLGYKICEHDPGGGDRNCCELDEDVPAGGRLRVYFFSAKDSGKRELAKKFLEEGKTVCDTFGIKTGEAVQLVSPAGKILHEKTAG